MDEKSITKLQDLFSYYDIHEGCIEEIFGIIDNRQTKTFINLFQQRTEQLKALGMRVTQTNNFEKLQGAPGLYSMKFKSPEINLRIIYSYNMEKPVMLLCCFYERDDSKETYSKYIPIAKKRKREMEERHGKNN